MRTRAAVSLLLVLASGLGGAGCQGIYHDSGEIYPPDPCARLRLRIDEACQAEKHAEKAAVRLREQCTKSGAGNALEPDVDRLEMAAREFGRRVAAVSDAVASCGQSEQFAAEMQRLQQRSAQILKTVQLIRGDGLSAWLPQLEKLLQNHSQP